ncbi:MAG TPA: hypothetical protein VFD73_19400 [Gemmatimonadales bacterium]|nr:hypothetical protein [Gemmatimonadales bacterium]
MPGITFEERTAGTGQPSAYKPTGERTTSLEARPANGVARRRAVGG